MLGGFRRFPAVGLKEHAHDILLQQLAASIKWDDRPWRLRYNPYAYDYNHAYPGDVQFRGSNGYRSSNQRRLYNVYDIRGHYIGSDPDPAVRSQLSHDPGQGRD